MGLQDANVLHTPAMGAAAKVLERMSAQVSQLEIAMDFKVPRTLMTVLAALDLRLRSCIGVATALLISGIP